MSRPKHPPEIPAPPKHLSIESKRLWRELISEYAIDDVASRLLLQSALEALDGMRAAEVLLRKDGTVFKDKFGQPRSHPANNLLRDSRLALKQFMAALHLDVAPGSSPRGGDDV